MSAESGDREERAAIHAAVFPARLRALPRPALLECFYLVAGLFLVIHYRWLIDDAFVYFRYVDNLLFLKVGLVYNAGEFVEGFSSPLYCLLLVGLRSLHLSWAVIVPLVGCISFSVFWYLLVVLNRALSPPSGVILNLPLAYLTFNYGVDSFFTSGLETPLTHVMAPLFALYLLRPGSRPLIGSLALAPLIRPELSLALGLAALFSWWRQRRFPWRLFIASGVTNASWLLFRVYYYADLFPNTFHLKRGWRPDQGLFYLGEVASTYHLVPALLLVFLLACAARARQPRRNGAGDAAFRGSERCAMLAIAVAGAAFAAGVGGTHVHYWYLAFPFSLALCSTAGILEDAFARLKLSKWPALGTLGMLGFSLLVFSWYPPQLSAHPYAGGAEHEPFHFIDDPIWHRRHPALQAAQLAQRVSIGDLQREGKRIATRGYRGTLDGTWCQRQYLAYGFRVVHGFGLTDAFLARTRAGWLKPGHKIALIPLSKDIARIQAGAERVGPGMYRRAVENATAPRWVAPNLAAIEVIERKVYNRHDFLENLRLAFRFPDRIVVSPAAGASEIPIEHSLPAVDDPAREPAPRRSAAPPGNPPNRRSPLQSLDFLGIQPTGKSGGKRSISKMVAMYSSFSPARWGL